MPKKSGIIFVMIGAVLILSALLLFFYNSYEDHRAGQEAENLLDDVQTAIVVTQPPTSEPVEETEATEASGPEETIPEETRELSPEMPVVQIKGYGYIGYLSIPSLELELPVMADWDYGRLKIAPCRHFGSSRTDDLVIAAHNYSHHFGKLSSLNEGDLVQFTDMEGIVSDYAVCIVDKLAPEAVDAVVYSGYDLVLYTCTPGGQTRVVVFCDRMTGESDNEKPAGVE